jgi:hypothetical protein
VRTANVSTNNKLNHHQQQQQAAKKKVKISRVFFNAEAMP